jgi:hypothetical protein
MNQDMDNFSAMNEVYEEVRGTFRSMYFVVFAHHRQVVANAETSKDVHSGRQTTR